MYRDIIKGVLREYSPSKRTICHYDGGNFSDNYYFLKFPGILFYEVLYRYNEKAFLAAFVKSPLQSEEDIVYVPPMPNIYINGWVCNGPTGVYFEEKINNFWQLRFGHDGDAGYSIIRELMNDSGASIDVDITNWFSIWSQFSMDEFWDKLDNVKNNFRTYYDRQYVARMPFKVWVDVVDARNCYPDSVRDVMKHTTFDFGVKYVPAPKLD
jgi:hypothetical protein